MAEIEACGRLVTKRAAWSTWACLAADPLPYGRRLPEHLLRPRPHRPVPRRNPGRRRARCPNSGYRKQARTRDGQTKAKELFVDVLRLIVSILVPPVGVLLQVGFGGQFLLNVLLTALGYFPGLIHAVWIIYTRR